MEVLRWSSAYFAFFLLRFAPFLFNVCEHTLSYIQIDVAIQVICPLFTDLSIRLCLHFVLSSSSNRSSRRSIHHTTSSRGGGSSSSSSSSNSGGGSSSSSSSGDSGNCSTYFKQFRIIS